MFLIFDTETTGLPRDYNAPLTDSDNWPRMVQLAWQLHDERGELLEVKNFIVRPEGYTIPYNAERIHGISTERAMREGVDLAFVLEEFNQALAKSQFNVGHNIEFDINILGAEFIRKQQETTLHKLRVLDTKEETTDWCAIPGGKGGKFKWPTLTELYEKLFGEKFAEAHNASADVEATTRAFLETVRIGIIDKAKLGFDDFAVKAFVEANPSTIQLIGLNIKPYSPLETAGTPPQQAAPEVKIPVAKVDLSAVSDLPFAHLHNHTQYSVLQSTTIVKKMVAKAIADKMPAVALTDSGNMMAAFQFVKEVSGYNKGLNDRKKAAEEKGEPFTELPLKGIIGCEMNLCRNRLEKTSKDNGYAVVLLAKNKVGYHNLAKMSSIAYTEGFYYLPRIDRETLIRYKGDLIATTGGLFGEIPNMILNIGENQAEEAFLWWKEQFGEDFYAELLRHGQPEEDKVNEVLLRFCSKHGVKYFAANNTFYLEKTDAKAHDILLCVKDGEKVSTPIGRGRGFRYGFPNDQYYFKSQAEMKKIFADLPDALVTIGEIIGKIESYELARGVLLPKFDIPQEFVHEEDKTDSGVRGENAFLRHLTYEGAKKRYPEITPDISERLDFELAVIANTGYPGYFLIVQDFTTYARQIGVSVGPGRGSAAGSAVAYCIGITNVDPIKYDLLFERFLNPDRVSMPDIDIDFDDRGRGRVIDYVVAKYGASQVAQIITYGTMAAKSALRDTARVLELPLPDADRLAKLMPESDLNIVLGASDEELKSKMKNSDQLELAKQMRVLAAGNDLTAQTLHQARMLEGSLRNTGVHACGVIITPEDISNLIPVANAKDSAMVVTQFDNSVVESAGLLKMDFLGLRNLTIINDAVENIRKRHGITIVPDDIPLDDVKTYELFQRGETNGIFQFESLGMQKYLKGLKPDKFDDLIAMNALYRPGPLEYIPNFIRRKHGLEPVVYDLADMEEYLKDTYGITVYQEQVMLLSQKLAGFTKGEADTLRKAMGKKDRPTLDKMKPKFLEGAGKNGHPKDVCEKVWTDWEAFAMYAFNKSHSTCYAYIAFHTAYLKANYTAEYMAAVLTNNMSNIKNVTFFMEECKRIRVPVLGPDVNESSYFFSVNDKGEIRFGLGAIKGVGEAAVASIVKERELNGPYATLFDFIKRLDYRSVNKKTIESMILAGALDGFDGVHRAVFYADADGLPFLERIMRYGQSYQEALNAPPDLFGDVSAVSISDPLMPKAEPWNKLLELAREKEVVGIFLTGHPLDDYRIEMDHYCSVNLERLQNLQQFKDKEISFAGIVVSAQERIDKNGNPFGIFMMEDFSGSYEFKAFREDYTKIRHCIVPNAFVFGRANVQQPWKDADRLDVKFKEISFLSEVMEKMTKDLAIGIPVEGLTPELVDRLFEIFDQHKGSTPVRIQLTDYAQRMEVSLPSKQFRVELSKELLTKIKESFALLSNYNSDEQLKTGFEAGKGRLSLTALLTPVKVEAVVEAEIDITIDAMDFAEEFD
ncbi:MAG: DNA polymerase III subunit alpha [Bacteroidota bacterium]